MIKINYKRSFILCILAFLFIATLSVSFASEDAMLTQNHAPDDEAIAVENVASDKEVLKDTQKDILTQDDGSLSGPLKTKITVKSVTGTPGKKVKVKAVVVDENGKKLSKQTVTFKVNGKKYTSQTNSKGLATLSIKVPKSKKLKVSTKTRNKILTKTTSYKKSYTCTAGITGDDSYQSSSTKFKLTSKKKKTQKYRIVKKQTKTFTTPYKKYGVKLKKSGHYGFAIFHEQHEVNRISIIGGDKTLEKFIKFSSKIFTMKHGQKIYPWKNKWMKSKKHDSIHQYFYTGDAKMYVTIKFNAYTYKRI